MAHPQGRMCPASGGPTAGLSERERRFIDAYMGPCAGNGTESARVAGYKGSAKVVGVQAARMLARASIQSAIAARRKELASTAIADAQERREVLTTILRSPETDPGARIKAVDVANRMDGVYVERHEVTATVTLAQLLGVMTVTADSIKH